MFICPKCYHRLAFFYPEQCVCGYVVPRVAGVYQFCDDPPIAVDRPGRRYLGYEHVGEDYEGGPRQEPVDDDYGIFGSCSRELVRLLGRGCTVLDLGCGLGPAAITLAMAGANVIAADISQTMLSVAAQRAAQKQLHGHLAFVRMNAYNLAICSNSVDAVVAIDVLHQRDDPEAAVKEILRVLKSEGVFVEYDSVGLPLTPEQQAINRHCVEMLRDIRRYYDAALVKRGYTGPPFSSWEKGKDAVAAYFEPPTQLRTDYEGVWTEQMRKGIHKLKTRAGGSAQLIPDDIHAAAWEETHMYAVSKYGEDYLNTPGYSRYSSMIKVYRPKNAGAKTSHPEVD